jgi:hypothetical protein
VTNATEYLSGASDEDIERPGAAQRITAPQELLHITDVHQPPIQKHPPIYRPSQKVSCPILCRTSSIRLASPKEDEYSAPDAAK